MNADDKDRIDLLTNKVDRVLFYFESDPTTKHIGLVEQVDINKKAIDCIKTENKVRIGRVGIIMSGVSMVLGIVGGFVAKYFMK